MNVRHAVIPVDLSGAARLRLPRIVQWLPDGSRLTLLHVVQGLDLPAWSVADPGMPREVREDVQAAEPLLEQMAREVAREGVEVQARIVIGQARAEAILEFARQNDVDLIALAPHGYRGLRKIVLGSVADRVLELSTLPVLVIPPVAADEPGADAVEGDAPAG